MQFCIAIIARALVTISTNRAGGYMMFASAADQDFLAGHPYIDKPDANAGATQGGSELVRTMSKNDSIRSMIIEGQKVQGLVYPFMARFESENGYVCGGSLIAPCVLLTAKHCTHITQGSEVKLGYFENVNNPPPPGEKFIVDKVVTPDFSIYPNDVGKDLMLVKIYGESIATPVDLDVVDGRCIPPCSTSTIRTENLDVTIPGWGSTDITKPRTFSDDLFKLDTKLTDKDTCDQNIGTWFQGQGLDYDQMICTNTEDATTFSGDSGGPLIITGTNRQIGVLYGAPTDIAIIVPVQALQQIASVYTNLRQADLLWINDYLIEWEDCNCTMEPSDQPSDQPSDHPSPNPSPSGPSESMQPSDQPSPNPSPSGPSESTIPSMSPSMSPTCHPSSTGHACGGTTE